MDDLLPFVPLAEVHYGSGGGVDVGGIVQAAGGVMDLIAGYIRQGRLDEVDPSIILGEMSDEF